MNRLRSLDRSALKELGAKLDRFAGNLNVLLVIIAIGLATLDVTFFLTQKAIGHMPPISRVVSVDASQAK